MRDLDIGAIPIGEKDRLVGMVTDRDIAIRGLTNGKNVASLTARDVMTKGIRARCKTQRSWGQLVAGAVLSSVATIAQLGILLAATRSQTLFVISIPLVSAGGAASVYPAVFALGTLRRGHRSCGRPWLHRVDERARLL